MERAEEIQKIKKKVKNDGLKCQEEHLNAFSESLFKKDWKWDRQLISTKLSSSKIKIKPKKCQKEQIIKWYAIDIYPINSNYLLRCRLIVFAGLDLQRKVEACSITGDTFFSDFLDILSNYNFERVYSLSTKKSIKTYPKNPASGNKFFEKILQNLNVCLIGCSILYLNINKKTFQILEKMMDWMGIVSRTKCFQIADQMYQDSKENYLWFSYSSFHTLEEIFVHQLEKNIINHFKKKQCPQYQFMQNVIQFYLKTHDQKDLKQNELEICLKEALKFTKDQIKAKRNTSKSYSQKYIDYFDDLLSSLNQQQIDKKSKKIKKKNKRKSKNQNPEKNTSDAQKKQKQTVSIKKIMKKKEKQYPNQKNQKGKIFEKNCLKNQIQRQIEINLKQIKTGANILNEIGELIFHENTSTSSGVPEHFCEQEKNFQESPIQVEQRSLEVEQRLPQVEKILPKSKLKKKKKKKQKEVSKTDEQKVEKMVFGNILSSEINSYVGNISVEIQRFFERKNKVCEMLTYMMHYFDQKILMNLFGSSAVGLSLPSSDLDIMLSNTSWKGLNQNQFKEVLTLIAQELSKYGWCVQCKLILHAKVPLIKLLIDPLVQFYQISPLKFGEINEEVSKQMLIKVDLTINSDQQNNSGLLSTALMKKVLDSTPHALKILLFLKDLIHQKQLNQIYKGGVSSYCLFLMIMSYVAQNLSFNQEITLGETLIHILEFYVQKFDVESTVIRYSLNKSQSNFISCKEIKQEITESTKEDHPKLKIIDPINKKLINASFAKYSNMMYLFEKILTYAEVVKEFTKEKIKHIISSQTINSEESLVNLSQIAIFNEIHFLREEFNTILK